jgi:hypothetical protein
MANANLPPAPRPHRCPEAATTEIDAQCGSLTDPRKLVYIPSMHLHRTVVILACSLLLACSDDGGEDTGADETSSGPGTTLTTTATTTDGGDTTTGNTFECDNNVQFALADGVGLGAMSVTATRLEQGTDVQYVIDIVGDAAETTQLLIQFNGVPAVDMEYQATELMQFGQPIVALLPVLKGQADFQSGTVTYTLVGEAESQVLEANFDLVFGRGPISGCVHAPLVVEML